MDSKLLEQKKNYLHYNDQKNELMKDLCEPLTTCFGAEWFARVTFVLDGEQKCVGHYGLITDIGFVKSYLFQFEDNGKSFTQAIKETPLDSYSYFPWSNINDCPLIQMKHRQHGITKGFSVYKRFQDRIEVWSFAGKDAKGIPSIATQTSILLFQNFIAYFNKQQKVNHLSCPFVNYAQSFDMSYNIPSDIQVGSFNTSIHADKFTLEIKDKLVSLSKREWECLSKFAEGKTYKGVANLLSLSPRTVETYLNQIKAKTGISSKAKLVDHFIEQNQSFFR